MVCELEGTTTVVLAGGGGLLLLMQPDNQAVASTKLDRILTVLSFELLGVSIVGLIGC